MYQSNMQNKGKNQTTFLKNKRKKEDVGENSLNLNAYVNNNIEELNNEQTYFIPKICYFCAIEDDCKLEYCSLCFKYAHSTCILKYNEDKSLNVSFNIQNTLHYKNQISTIVSMCTFCNDCLLDNCYSCKKIVSNDIKLICELCNNKFHISCSDYIDAQLIFQKEIYKQKYSFLEASNIIKAISTSEDYFFHICNICLDRNISSNNTCILGKSFLNQKLTQRVGFINQSAIHEYFGYIHQKVKEEPKSRKIQNIDYIVNKTTNSINLTDLIKINSTSITKSSRIDNETLGFYLVKWIEDDSDDSFIDHPLYTLETKEFIKFILKESEIKTFERRYLNSFASNDNNNKSTIFDSLITSSTKEYQNYLQSNNISMRDNIAALESLKSLNVFYITNNFHVKGFIDVFLTSLCNSLIKNNFKILIVSENNSKYKDKIQLSDNKYVVYKQKQKLLRILNELYDFSNSNCSVLNNLKYLIGSFQGTSSISIDNIFANLQFITNNTNRKVISPSCVFTSLESYITDVSLLNKGFDLTILDVEEYDIDFSKLIYPNMKSKVLVVSQYNNLKNHNSPFTPKYNNFLLAFYSNTNNFYDTSIKEVNKRKVVNRKYLSNDKKAMFLFTEEYLKWKIIEITQDMNAPSSSNDVLSYGFINKDSSNDNIKKLNLRFYLNLVSCELDVDDFYIYLLLLREYIPNIRSLANQIEKSTSSSLENDIHISNLQQLQQNLLNNLYHICFAPKLLSKDFYQMGRSLDITINSINKSKLDTLVLLIKRIIKEMPNEKIYIVFTDNLLDEDSKSNRVIKNEIKIDIEKYLNSHQISSSSYAIHHLKDPLVKNININSKPSFIILNFDIQTALSGKFYREVFSHFRDPNLTIKIYQLYCSNTVEQNLIKLFYENFEASIYSDIKLTSLTNGICSKKTDNIIGINLLNLSKLNKNRDFNGNKKLIINENMDIKDINNGISMINLYDYLIRKNILDLRFCKYSNLKEDKILFKNSLSVNDINGIIMCIKGENSIMINSNNIFTSLTDCNCIYDNNDYSYDWDFIFNIFEEKNLTNFNIADNFNWDSLVLMLNSNIYNFNKKGSHNNSGFSNSLKQSNISHNQSNVTRPASSNISNKRIIIDDDDENKLLSSDMNNSQNNKNSQLNLKNNIPLVIISNHFNIEKPMLSIESQMANINKYNYPKKDLIILVCGKFIENGFDNEVREFIISSVVKFGINKQLFFKSNQANSDNLPIVLSIKNKYKFLDTKSIIAYLTFCLCLMFKINDLNSYSNLCGNFICEDYLKFMLSYKKRVYLLERMNVLLSTMDEITFNSGFTEYLNLIQKSLLNVNSNFNYLSKNYLIICQSIKLLLQLMNSYGYKNFEYLFEKEFEYRNKVELLNPRNLLSVLSNNPVILIQPKHELNNSLKEMLTQLFDCIERDILVD